MKRFIDLTGQRFGRLTAIEKSPQKRYTTNAWWLCRCDCGKEIIVPSNRLRGGTTTSCGCYAREFHSKLAKQTATTHGESKTRLYQIWADMKSRCTNDKHKRFKDWGGRGITVCGEWHEFEPFRDWALANGYKNNLTLDRIDNNAGYSPENCRWATRSAQQRNKRNNQLINGKTLAEWAEESGINENTLWYRIHVASWPIEKAIATPVLGRKKA